ncbi:recombinase family protein [Streptomyces sp. R39]|uniref:Recombinase family protein n=1 Tax=Streptomyces sp. R39 TaxID=3238631 RepID=A0AB39QG08_9ACTN
MPALRRPARLTLPLALGRSRRDLPHRPVQEGRPARQTAAGADPGRPRPRPALATRHPAAGRARDGHPGRGHPHRIRPLQPPHPGAAVAAGGAQRARHPRDKIFSEKISTRIRGRPQFEAALTLAREIKAHAPHCRVLFTVYEMKRLGRDAAELTALADHLTAHGLVLEMLAGPLPGIYDPSGPGRMLFGFFAAMAETERESIREATSAGCGH